MIKSWYEQAEKVVTKHSHGYIDGLTNEEVDEDGVYYGTEDEEDYSEREDSDNTVLIDVQTANMLVTVANYLNPATSKKFTETPIVKAVELGWKCVK